jgi:GntR family transcriptional regulator
MRFWITKNSISPIREQLVRQVVLGILSGDLTSGQKLPSVRALARRYGIHSNTVSTAYQRLREEGWLEVRQGSGLYVRPLALKSDRETCLDELLRNVLEAAKLQGYQSADVLRRLDQLVHPRGYERILVIDPELELREILRQEISLHVTVSVETIEEGEFPKPEQLHKTVMVALPKRVASLRREMPAGVPCLALKLRSVEASLKSSTKPEPDALVTIVSRSSDFRRTARTMLLAVGLSPDALCEIDAAMNGWRDRIIAGAFVVSDVATTDELPSFCQPNVFRLIADASIAELKDMTANQPL